MMTCMRTGTSLLVAAAVAISAGGCASRGNVELLEGRLRQKEDQIYGLRRELTSTKTELAAARREASALRTRVAEQTAASPSGSPAPEQIASLSRVEGVQISRMLSGGLNRDDQPGDDVLTTLVIPVDSHGELVKAPGAVRLELLDLTQNGAGRQLGVWEFTPEQAEQFWKKGLFGSGYAIQVPWQQPPQSSKVMLHARLTTVDGRQFDTSQEVKVTPPALAARPPSTLSGPDVPSLSPDLMTPVSATTHPASTAGDISGEAPPFSDEPSPQRARLRAAGARLIERRAAPAASGGIDEEAAGVVRLGGPADEEANPFERTAQRVEAPAPSPRGVEATSDRWTELSRPTWR